jgi:penicillin-binding protein A
LIQGRGTILRLRGWKNYQKGLPKRSRFSFRFRLDLGPYKKSLKAIAIFSVFLSILVIVSLSRKATRQETVVVKKNNELYVKALTTIKPNEIASENIFRKVNFDDGATTYYTRLSLDERLQKRMENLLGTYKPPYAAVLAMDPDTGKVLAMASYSKYNNSGTNLCLKSQFMAASIFKMVTSAAAIEKIPLDEDSRIGFNGSVYRLKERNVFDRKNRFANSMTLGEAFAKSANIVYAKLTQRGIKPSDLRAYSSQFLFNQSIPFDLEVEESEAQIPDDSYELAKTAAGFGDVTLSPLHGAVIVSSILSEGRMVSPYVLDKIYNSERVLVYNHEPEISEQIIQPKTAAALKNMMEMTLTKGTIRKSFRGWTRDRVLNDLTIGGKTGSLNGRTITGEHNWFVGFAEGDGKKLVVASVIVNHALWHIKPTYLAKEAFLTYFKDYSKPTRRVFR